jgi:ribonuclease E
MSKTMLINVTHAEESRVGIVADGVLTAFEIESFSREHLKGNIYKGLVHRIHPALEAAFVDIGADRDAFLPLDEICFRNLPAPVRNGSDGGEGRRRPRINEVLKPGEEVLVQIAKEQFGNKPPTLSTFYSLPGRYLVLLPGSDEAGISRRIEGSERLRIRELIEKLHPPDGFGIIVRTVAGFDPGARELHRDLAYLLRLWESIQQAAATKRAPAMVYREHDLVLRNIRDYFTPDIDEIYVDNEDVFQRAREFLRDVMPGKEDALRLYQGDQPLFSHFNVEAQIESIYKRRVPLKSGGSIVIDGTEALTAIDVNSGRSVRGGSQEETAFRTNMEAAVEIARQLRLRDLGGLIVVDFIDMRDPHHITEVEKALRAAMHEDKARHEVGRISHFGLLEVSRQRLRPAAAATSYVACPMCEGHGLVRTTESAALVALRKIHNRVAQGDVATLRVAVPPDVAVYLLNQKREDLAQLERRYGTRLHVVLKEELMPHQSEFEVRQRVEGEFAEPAMLRLGGVAASQPAAPPAAGANGAAVAAAAGATPAAAAPVAPPDAGRGAKRRRRRRGRRRGRGREAAAAVGEALAALGVHTSLGRPLETPAAVLPSAALGAGRDQEGEAGAPTGATSVPSVPMEPAVELRTKVGDVGAEESLPSPEAQATAPPAAARRRRARSAAPGRAATGRRTPRKTVGRRAKPEEVAAGAAPVARKARSTGTAARRRRSARSKVSPTTPVGEG